MFDIHTHIGPLASTLVFDIHTHIGPLASTLAAPLTHLHHFDSDFQSITVHCILFQASAVFAPAFTATFAGLSLLLLLLVLPGFHCWWLLLLLPATACLCCFDNLQGVTNTGEVVHTYTTVDIRKACVFITQDHRRTRNTWIPTPWVSHRTNQQRTEKPIG